MQSAALAARASSLPELKGGKPLPAPHCHHCHPATTPLQECWWVSAIGAFCSLTYCFIGLVLGCIYANNGLGSVGGRDGNSPTDKALSERGRTAAHIAHWPAYILAALLHPTSLHPAAPQHSPSPSCSHSPPPTQA